MEKLLAIREETVKNLRVDDDRFNKLELLETIQQIDRELGSAALFTVSSEYYTVPDPVIADEENLTLSQSERLF